MASRIKIVISNLSGKRRALSTAVNMLAVAELYSFTTLSSFFRMADTAEQEAQHKEDLHLGGRGIEVIEDDAITEVVDGQDVDNHRAPSSRTGRARTAGPGNSLQNSKQKTLLVKKTR